MARGRWRVGVLLVALGGLTAGPRENLRLDTVHAATPAFEIGADPSRSAGAPDGAAGELIAPMVRRRHTQPLEAEAALAQRGFAASFREGNARAASSSLPDIRVNDPTGQTPFTGNTQMEPAIAASGDTVVCGFTDSQGFFGTGTLSGFAVSFDRGRTWTDGGSLPRTGTGASEMVFGDPSVCTDGRGRWYYLSLYDVGNGTQGPGSGDIGLVLHVGRFLGAALQWTGPQVVAGGTPVDQADSPHLAIDPDRDRLYAAFTNLGASTPWGQVEVVTLDLAGVPQQRVVVQAHTSGTNNAGPRVAVGPDGETYCAFESGFFTGDGLGPAYQKLSRSLDHGATFSSPVVAGTVIESWLSAPPGSNREEECVEFPSLAVDRSSGPNRGRVYLAWHDAVSMSFGGTWQTVTEAATPNDTPAQAQLLPTTSALQIDGNLSTTDPGDWYRFAGQAGEHLRMVLRPNAYMKMGLRLRWLDPGGAAADTIFAASARRTGEMVFFLFTLPVNGDYAMQIERRQYAGSYTGWLRRTTATNPSTGQDHRDIVVVSSPNGIGGWTPKVRVNDDTGSTDQAFPEVVVDGDGGVHVTWYDRRYDARTRVLANAMLASSFDGGSSFTPNRRVSSVSSYWQVPADAIPNFGDRFLPLAAGSDLYAVWSDGRTGDPDVRIAPLGTAFDAVYPDSIRIVPGQRVGLAITVHNRTPYDDARFTVRIDPDTPDLPETQYVLGPVETGESATALYDPLVEDWNTSATAIVRVRVQSDRSARDLDDTILAYNDAVPVLVQDFAAERRETGVHLAWQAPRGLRFDVERARTSGGPYATLTAAPLAGGPQGAFEFEDTTAPAGERVAYRLLAVMATAERTVFGPWMVEVAAPRRVALLGAHPNPFGPATSIRYELPRATPVTLRILDVRGRLVATLSKGAARAGGLHAMAWDGRDADGRRVPAGVYVAVLETPGRREAARMVLLR